MTDENGLPTTVYFRENVLAKRTYIKIEWLVEALANPVRTEVQPLDGRIRHFVWIQELNHYLRVVTLEVGKTIHNAFPDRRFKL